MDLDSPSPLTTPGFLTPTSLARKRTWADLTTATNSLALETPIEQLEESYFPIKRAASPPKRVRVDPAAIEEQGNYPLDGRGFVRVDGMGPVRSWARPGRGGVVLVYVPPWRGMGHWWEVLW